MGKIVKELGLVYKRFRKSCKHKRNEEQFRCCQSALIDAQEAERKGLINLFYFDESGFSQEPCVPYGWQEKGKQLVPIQKQNAKNKPAFRVKKILTLQAGFLAINISQSL